MQKYYNFTLKLQMNKLSTNHGFNFSKKTSFCFQVIIMSEDFQRFFDRSTRLVERALCEMADANLFVDYTGGYGDDDNEGLDGDKSGISNF